MSILNSIGRSARRLLAASACLASLGVGAADAPSVAWPTHGWPVGTPTGDGLDEATLSNLDADLAAGKYGIVDSFEVFRCGEEAFSRRYTHDYKKIYGKQATMKGPLNARLGGRYNYFDPAWHPYYHGTQLHTMQSVTKTFTSAIIGVARTRGDFKADLDTPVLKYFDTTRIKNLDDRKRRMTLKDVLTMTTGLDWNEDVAYDDPRNDADLMEATNDWVQYVIDKPMAHEPGTVFDYSSGATELLAYIFKKETGQDIEAYGEKYLFTPLGIRHYWKRNYRGLVDTEGGLYASGSDLAKLGLLFLHGGQWDGTQVMAEDWVQQSVTPYIDTGWQGLKYGFKWWLYPPKDGKQLVWMGIGFAGQRLMVFPDQQLIATFTGWDILQDPEVDADLAERVLPAVRDLQCRNTPQ